jgi:hypothetical protein
MRARYFNPGDQVAILPRNTALPSEVLEIATIEKSGPGFVELKDGRRFATLHGCIVLARAEHRIALDIAPTVG